MSAGQGEFWFHELSEATNPLSHHIATRPSHYSIEFLEQLAQSTGVSGLQIMSHNLTGLISNEKSMDSRLIDSLLG